MVASPLRRCQWEFNHFDGKFSGEMTCVNINPRLNLAPRTWVWRPKDEPHA